MKWRNAPITRYARLGTVLPDMENPYSKTLRVDNVKHVPSQARPSSPPPRATSELPRVSVFFLFHHLVFNHPTTTDHDCDIYT